MIGLPHISNFDDCDPLEGEEGVRPRYLEVNDALGTPDLIVFAGSKANMADLEWLRHQRLEEASWLGAEPGRLYSASAAATRC